MDDDPALQWPAWKFGMKRDELFTTLYDQYNTIPSAIQDNEAFHHDVYEISNVATNTDEFHRLLADRKEQRIRELNEPETDLMTFSGTLSRDHDDEMSQSDDPDTPTTSISDFSETRSLPEYPSKDEVEDESITPAACDDAEEEVEEEGDAVSETPTPRNESSSDSYVNAKPSSI
ncbi:hypothetical protein UCREL1_8428 [Eutypa lata UCREL1]|uniref:Uncharacterized protein n=1 Tax=Eutypa lata (strain UCR-EL1) TaxID=1287681 RepID=M7SKB0_EUTLA|nr:hypothetical protein UCREL1_8428 [Eutypa lata UCREL1]